MGKIPALQKLTHMSNCENKNCSEPLLTNGMGLDSGRKIIGFVFLRIVRPGLVSGHLHRTEVATTNKYIT